MQSAKGGHCVSNVENKEEEGVERMEALTLGQWQDQDENADAVPTGLPEDSMNVDQIEHLLDHLVCSGPPLGAELGAGIGVELVVNINLVLLILVYVVFQGVQGLAVLVDSEA